MLLFLLKRKTLQAKAETVEAISCGTVFNGTKSGGTNFDPKKERKWKQSDKKKSTNGN